MLRRLLTSVASLSLALPALAPAPAHALAEVTASSPACNTIRFTNHTSGVWWVGLETLQASRLDPGRSVTMRVPAGGDYLWDLGRDGTDESAGVGRVRVAACSGTPQRTREGDQNGDGRADVFGIQAGTGDLYYYAMGRVGLAEGIKVGRGWNDMVFLQHVPEIDGPGSPNRLVAVRKDGTVWSFASLGRGRLGAGTQIGRGFVGYSNFAVTQTSHGLSFGAHALVAAKDGVLRAWYLDSKGLHAPQWNSEDLGIGETGQPGWKPSVKTISLRDFDGDNRGDFVGIGADGAMHVYSVDAMGYLTPPRKVGSGWGQMQTVASPGSLDGDHLGDLVARRSDGNLYKYTNRGGRWSEGIRIGQRWNGIRLLA